jgi:hypothetical protein
MDLGLVARRFDAVEKASIMVAKMKLSMLFSDLGFDFRSSARIQFVYVELRSLVMVEQRRLRPF